MQSFDKKMDEMERGASVTMYEPQTDTRVTWRSCCLETDKEFFTFIIQTLIGVGLFTFCAYSLRTELNCDKAAPYWGLIGTLCGFFFRKLTAGSSVIRRKGTR
jgi:hypothetical protein